MFDKLLSVLNSEILPETPSVHHSGDIILYRKFREHKFPVERGAASLTIDGDSLHAYGLFQDADPFNKATQDNQKTWMLGDVFELFFSFPGDEDYYEYHSTPEGIRLQLHIQDYRTFRDIPHEQRIGEFGLIVKNRIDRENKLWYSELIVPLKGRSADGGHFAFAHYNYTGDTPEISSYPDFPVTVHTPYLWPEFKSK